VADMERRAQAIVDRMAANFAPLTVVKLMGWVMSNVFHRLYQAVFLNSKDLDLLQKVCEIIFFTNNFKNTKYQRSRGGPRRSNGRSSTCLATRATLITWC
jgi:hypothetical protein